MRLLTALLATAALAAAATPAQAGKPGLPHVKVASCSIEKASAVFVARMRQVRGGARMAVRYKLLEKSDLGFHTLKAPKLGRWRKSKPGVGAFSYRQAVRGLEQGSLYRAQVEFRWYDEEGNVIAAAVRRSPPCRQFDVLPNLTAAPLGVRSLKEQPGVFRYRVVLTNEGIAPATGVPVRVSVDGTVLGTQVVASLKPAERRVVAFDGPRCIRSVKVEVDPDGVIVESAEADNRRELPCADLP